MDNYNTTPGYFIYRDGPADGPFDPTAPLQFFPPKDSDDLFFALKSAYPSATTHSERMRNAVIDFLLSERDSAQVNSQSPSYALPEASVDSQSASPSWQSASSSSVHSSPVLQDNASPAPTATSTSPRTLSRSTTTQGTSAPAIDQMTSVFCLATHVEPKMRSRRKMTEAEKVEYRKRRQVRACPSCSKRKRKCVHNKEHMDNIAPSQRSPIEASTRISTKAIGKRRARPVVAQQQDSVSAMTPPSFSAESSIEDLINLDVETDFAAPQFAWADDKDWTLLDTDFYSPNMGPLDPQLLLEAQDMTLDGLRAGTAQHLILRDSSSLRSFTPESSLQAQNHVLSHLSASPTQSLPLDLFDSQLSQALGTTVQPQLSLLQPLPSLVNGGVNSSGLSVSHVPDDNVLIPHGESTVTPVLDATASRQRALLKRRIPKALHSILPVQANSVSSSVDPDALVHQALPLRALSQEAAVPQLSGAQIGDRGLTSIKPWLASRPSENRAGGLANGNDGHDHVIRTPAQVLSQHGRPLGLVRTQQLGYSNGLTTSFIPQSDHTAITEWQSHERNLADVQRIRPRLAATSAPLSRNVLAELNTHNKGLQARIGSNAAEVSAPFPLRTRDVDAKTSSVYGNLSGLSECNLSPLRAQASAGNAEMSASAGMHNPLGHGHNTTDVLGTPDVAAMPMLFQVRLASLLALDNLMRSIAQVQYTALAAAYATGKIGEENTLASASTSHYPPSSTLLTA